MHVSAELVGSIFPVLMLFSHSILVTSTIRFVTSAVCVFMLILYPINPPIDLVLPQRLQSLLIPDELITHISSRRLFAAVSVGLVDDLLLQSCVACYRRLIEQYASVKVTHRLVAFCLQSVQKCCQRLCLYRYIDKAVWVIIVTGKQIGRAHV